MFIVMLFIGLLGLYFLVFGVKNYLQQGKKSFLLSTLLGIVFLILAIYIGWPK